MILNIYSKPWMTSGKLSVWENKWRGQRSEVGADCIHADQI